MKRTWLAAGGVTAVVLLGGGLFLLMEKRNGEGPGEPGANPREAAPAPIAERAPPEPAPPVGKSAKPPAPAPEDPRSVFAIAARLLRSDGSPAAGVPVHLEHRREGGPALPKEVVRSGADGRWLLRGVPPFEMVIDDPGSALLVLDFWLHDEEREREVDLGDLTLAPPHSLRVQVVGPDDRPVRKAKVIAWPWPELGDKGFRAAERQVPETGEGEYVLERLPPGKHLVQVRADGFVFKPRSPAWVEVPQVEPILLRLESGARIAGMVLDPAGKPVPGAELTLSGGSPESQYYEGIRADAAGRFEIDYLVPGEYEVRVEAKRYASWFRRGIATGGEDVEFILEPEAVFSGRVVDEEGNPVVRATVALSYETAKEDGLSGFGRQTDAEGRFQFDRVDGGVFEVSAHHDAFLPFQDAQDLELVSGQTVEGKVIRLARGLQASGRVTDSGDQKPIAGADVKFRFLDPERRKGERHSYDSKYAMTGADGAFVVKGLREGEYEVSCSAKGYFGKKGERVALSGRSLEGLELTLEPGASISGLVLDPDGKPVAGAQVSARAALMNDLHSTSDREGGFRIVALPEAPDYLVKARHDEFAPATVRGISVKGREDVSGIEIRLSKGGSIRGRVRGPGGIAIAKSRVYATGASREDGEDSAGRGAESDDEGNYEISRLLPGTYAVTARSPGLVRAEKGGVQVEEGKAASGVDFTLGAGKSLSGRVVDAGGRPIEGAAVELVGEGGIRAYTVDSATTGSDGRFTVKWGDEMQPSLSAQTGAYQVVVRGAESCDARFELNLPEGVRELDFPIELPASGIVGVVVDARSGEALPRATLAAVAPASGGRPSPLGDRGFRAMASADDSGRFAMSCLAPGTYDLWAWSEGHAASRVPDLRVGAGKNGEDLRLALEAEAVVSGRVVDGRGLPVDGARGYLRDAEGNVVPWRTSRWSDVRGSMEIHGVGKGRYLLTVLHPSFARSEVPLPAGGDEEPVVVRLNPGGGVRVEVVDGSGRPLEGIPLEVLDARGVSLADELSLVNIDEDLPFLTGADGSLSIDHLAAGPYRVLAMSRDSRPSEATFTVVSGRTTRAKIVLSR